MKGTQWEPAEFIPREQIIKNSEELLAMPDIPIRQSEDIIRIHILGMNWNIGVFAYEPESSARMSMRFGEA